MKALKIILIILLILVLLIGGGIYWVIKNIDGFIVSGIESIGSEVLQTQVTLDDANFEISKGRGELHGLSIANPAGFSEPTLFSLDQIALQIEPESVNSNVVVLNEILIDGAHLTVEHDGADSTNIQTLMDNVKRNISSTEENQTEAQSGQEPRFMVEKLTFSNMTMRVVSPLMENREYRLQDIRRENLGSRDQGLTGAELAEAIAQPLVDSAREKLEERAEEAASKALEEELSEEDREKLNQFRQLLQTP